MRLPLRRSLRTCGWQAAGAHRGDRPGVLVHALPSDSSPGPGDHRARQLWPGRSRPSAATKGRATHRRHTHRSARRPLRSTGHAPPRPLPPLVRRREPPRTRHDGRASRQMSSRQRRSQRGARCRGVSCDRVPDRGTTTLGADSSSGELLIGRRAPAGKEIQCLLASRSDLGCKGEHHEVRIGGKGHPLVGEL